MGYPSAATTGEGFPLTLPRNHRSGAYFLDEWKASSRLTLNLGLRWDYYGVPVDSGGYWRTLSLKQLTNAPGVGSLPTVIPPGRPSPAGAIELWSYGAGAFQPRVGIAFRPTDKWVVRTGAGMFSSVQHMNNFTILNLMPPLSGSDTYNSVTDPAQSGARVFRPGSAVLTLDNPFNGTARARRTNLLMVPPDFKQMTVWQWSFDIQRQLPLQSVLTVGYVGSKSTHIANSIANYNSPQPSSDTGIDARRPIQRYFDSGTVYDLGTIRYLDSYANGNYHGLQVTAEKRYTAGFTFGLSYTYSKALGEGQAGGNEAAILQNPLDRRLSRARYDYDIRHNMVLHYVWEVPFFKHLHGVPGAVLSGWQTNGILTLRTGLPFNVTQSGDLNTGGTVLPDRIADGRLPDGKRSRALWFDPLAFQRVTCNIPSRPDLCHYGSSGINVIESPGLRNLDFSLFKNFTIREGMRLQFRSEFFNATNSPHFGAPNGISFTTTTSVTPNGARMGEIRSLRQPMRIIQFGLKFLF